MGVIWHLSLIGGLRPPLLLPPLHDGAYYAAATLAALLVALAIYQARRRYLVRRWRLASLLALVPLALVSAHVATLQFWPGPYSWLTAGRGLAVPLLALAPVVVAAAYCGPIEAVLVGVTSSLAVAAWQNHNPLIVLEGGYVALAMSVLLRQPYKGRVPSLLRQPALAAPLAALLTWPLALLSGYGVTFGAPLTSLVGGLNFALVSGALALGQAVLAGALLQLLYLTPLGKPVAEPSRVPPWARSLRAQVLATYLPVAAVALVTVVGVASYAAVSAATRWALDEAARDASDTAQRLSSLIERGQAYLAADIRAPELLERTRRQDHLRRSLELYPTFSELLLVSERGVVLAAAPNAVATLSDEERQALSGLAPEASALAPAHRGDDGVFLTLASPRGEAGRLLARISQGESQPWLEIVTSLQWTMDAGNGFVVDDQQRIIAHPERAYLLTLWDAHPQYARYYATATGAAYDGPDSSGQRHFVYTLPVAGYPWQVVVEIPSEVILQLALGQALPLFALAGALALVGTGIILIAAWRYSRPLVRLSATAGQIAAGDLNVEVSISGQDEIGRLGRSFEQMRQALRRRLSDLGLLLDVVRSVSSSQDWSFQPILRAAMSGTQAVAACICLSEGGSPNLPVAQEGTFAGWGEVLPPMQHIAREARRQRRPLPVRSLARYYHQAPQAATAGLRSAICLPLHVGERVLGVMWVLYAERQHFDELDVNLLSTLAGQAAVVYGNNRLLTDAQGERGRLRAIVASTSDAIVVADRQGRLILANPAARQLLSLPERSLGTPLAELWRDEALPVLLGTPIEGAGLARALHLDSGTTLHAVVSPVALSDGGDLGRVIVLRDVSDLTQRESERADVVATLSRNLRNPLTYTRGYASMIPRVGDLNSQQAEFVERIVRNVDNMTGLLENLVDLNNIELGAGLHLERCPVPGAVEAALAAVRQETERRQHNVRLDVPPSLPPVRADRNLLVRALTCLLDNAAKYMRDGGTIGVKARLQAGGVLISVSDQGVGIGAADQQRVFEPFYRVERPETRSASGYGLGLAIVRAIADGHGGRVTVESDLGRGSRFSLWLPKHETEEERG